MKDTDHHCTSVIAPYGTHTSPRLCVWWNLNHRMSDDVTPNENEIENENYTVRRGGVSECTWESRLPT